MLLTTWMIYTIMGNTYIVHIFASEHIELPTFGVLLNDQMKISTLLFGAAFTFMLASCSETKVEDKSATTPTETPAANPEATPENSTEIRVGSDGGEVKSKDGETETEIKVNEDETEIIIKK